MRNLLSRFFAKLRLGLCGDCEMQSRFSLFRFERAGRVWFCRFRPVFVRNRGWFRSEENREGDVEIISIFAFWLDDSLAANPSYSPSFGELMYYAHLERLQNFYTMVAGQRPFHWRARHSSVDADFEIRVREFWQMLKSHIDTRDDQQVLTPLFEHEIKLINLIASKTWTPHPTLENVNG